MQKFGEMKWFAQGNEVCYQEAGNKTQTPWHSLFLRFTVFVPFHDCAILALTVKIQPISALLHREL